MKDESCSMMISSCWGVLIYDWWTNEQSFVNVELLLRLKIILHQSTVNYKDKWFFFECIVFLVYMMHAIIIWLFTSCIFNHCNVILNYGEYHWFIIYIYEHKYAIIVLHFIGEVNILSHEVEIFCILCAEFPVNQTLLMLCDGGDTFTCVYTTPTFLLHKLLHSLKQDVSVYNISI